MSSLPLPVAAFSAGLISFVTPCVLPLVPGYVSLISGTGVEELKRPNAHVMRIVMFNSLLFIFGFTLIFMALGAVASSLGRIVQQHFDLLSKIAGLIIIVFGLHKTGLVPIKFFYRDAHFRSLAGKTSASRAFLVGLAFGFGWTPCVGPILTVILTFAASEATLGKGIGLLALYSAGLAIPFLLTSLGIERFLLFYGKFRRHMRAIEAVSGALLIAVGVLIFTRHFSLLNSWMNRIPFFRHLGEKFL
jgi:cytochrome c-type biogenesis protein